MPSEKILAAKKQVVADLVEAFKGQATFVFASARGLTVAQDTEMRAELRKAGVRAEVYPEAGAKMKKQMSYANAKQIPYVVIIGGDEVANQEVSLKNMITGEQEKVKASELASKF